MTNFEENPTKIKRSISDGILPGKIRVKIRLALKDGIKKMILTLINVFYLFHNPSNLVSLGLLNNTGIFYHNKDQTLYNQKTRKIFAFAKRYNTNFFLSPLNLLIVAVNLLKHNDIYKSKKPNIY